MKVFLPGAGNKVEHIRCFQQLPEVSEVIVSDIYPWAYGHFVADRSYVLPPFAHERFWESFERVYEEEKFDVCVPLHDAALIIFSRQRERLLKFPFLLAINPAETVELVADKLAQYRFFREHDLPTPELHLLSDFLRRAGRTYPVYIKPRFIHYRGTSRQFFMKVEDEEGLRYAAHKLAGQEDEFVVQAFVEGVEINIDFFCDNDGIPQGIVSLKRLAMGASRGISRGEIIDSDLFAPFVHQITKRIHLWAANQLQAFQTKDGRILLTEINGRFSGSSILVKEAGINFFAYLLMLMRGEPLPVCTKPRRLKMTSWEQPVFYEEPPARRMF